MERHLLIACYYFPPYPSIGGRRTAKLARALAERGWTVHVIGAANPYPAQSRWTGETRHERIRYYPLPLRYPKPLLYPEEPGLREETLGLKLRARLAAAWYRRTQQGRIFDPTLRWEAQFTRQAELLLDQYPIRTLWVSISPHYYAWYAARIRQRRPDLHLLLDFRDPWLRMRDFGMQSMSPGQLARERAIVAETLGAADAVTGTSEFNVGEFEGLCKPGVVPEVIEHFYDPAELQPYLDAAAPPPGGVIRLVYGGTLYSDVEPALRSLSAALTRLQETDPEGYRRLRIDFYSHQRQYEGLFAAHAGQVQFMPPIGQAIFRELAASSMILILHAAHNQHIRTTKFYECLPFGKPYLYLGPAGGNYRFVREHGLGAAFDEAEPPEALAAFLSQAEAYVQAFRPGLPHELFSLGRQTDRITALIK
ncbi:MAG: hypothetical protein NW241_04755 [Bacteroidia bacterium]|nr:hypothetical protein [Bacteroidia bacterium]